MGVAALSVLTLVGGTAMAANAASNNSNKVFGRGKKMNIENRTPLTATQIADMKAKQATIKTALENSDYNAWVAAVKAENANSPLLTKITSDKFAQYVSDFKTREAKMTEQKTKVDAIETALKNSDYNAWVTAVKVENTNSPLLTKITSSNFASYVQAYNLRKQADTIMKGLGVNGEGFGMGGRGQVGSTGEMGGFEGMGFGGMHRNE